MFKRTHRPVGLSLLLAIPALVLTLLVMDPSGQLGQVSSLTATGSLAVSGTGSVAAPVVGSGAVSSAMSASGSGVIAPAVTGTGSTAVSSSASSLSSVTSSLRKPMCGNSVLEVGEECEDGNVLDGDGCSAMCRHEAGPEPRCGDGLQSSDEECDDGDQNSDTEPDTCRVSCRVPACGDSVVDTGELCDDGNDIEGDSCTNSCTFSECGNNVLELDEECDAGTKNSDTVSNSCRLLCVMPRCGDGVIDSAFGETCDTGIDNAAEPDLCRPWCSVPTCGDGIIDTKEQCDDGNAIAGDGCDAVCAVDIVALSSAASSEEMRSAAPATMDLLRSPALLAIPVMLVCGILAWMLRKLLKRKH